MRTHTVKFELILISFRLYLTSEKFMYLSALVSSQNCILCFALFGYLEKNELRKTTNKNKNLIVDFPETVEFSVASIVKKCN